VLNSTSLICGTAFEENILPEEQIIEKHVKTFLDIIILAMLNGKVTYGYKIIAVIHTEFGVLLSPASLYPLLHLLEQNKLVESNFDQGKTMYCLTPKGKDTFERKLASYNLSIQIMSNFMRVHGKIW